MMSIFKLRVTLTSSTMFPKSKLRVHLEQVKRGIDKAGRARRRINPRKNDWKSLRSGKKVDINVCLDSMGQLQSLPMTALLLRKHPDIIITIKQCRKFTGSSEVRDKAELLYNKLKVEHAEMMIFATQDPAFGIQGNVTPTRSSIAMEGVASKVQGKPWQAGIPSPVHSDEGNLTPTRSSIAMEGVASEVEGKPWQAELPPPVHSFDGLVTLPRSSIATGSVSSKIKGKPWQPEILPPVHSGEENVTPTKSSIAMEDVGSEVEGKLWEPEIPPSVHSDDGNHTLPRSFIATGSVGSKIKRKLWQPEILPPVHSGEENVTPTKSSIAMEDVGSEVEGKLWEPEIPPSVHSDDGNHTLPRSFVATGSVGSKIKRKLWQPEILPPVHSVEENVTATRSSIAMEGVGSKVEGKPWQAEIPPPVHFDEASHDSDDDSVMDYKFVIESEVSSEESLDINTLILKHTKRGSVISTRSSIAIEDVGSEVKGKPWQPEILPPVHSGEENVTRTKSSIATEDVGSKVKGKPWQAAIPLPVYSDEGNATPTRLPVAMEGVGSNIKGKLWQPEILPSVHSDEVNVTLSRLSIATEGVGSKVKGKPWQAAIPLPVYSGEASHDSGDDCDDSVKDPDYKFVIESEMSSEDSLDINTFILKHTKRGNVNVPMSTYGQSKVTECQRSHSEHLPGTSSNGDNTGNVTPRLTMCTDITSCENTEPEMPLAELLPEASTSGGTKRDPSRPCPYCYVFQTKLTRHLMKKHSDEEKVKQALKLSKKSRDAAFALLKKSGIYKYNIKLIAAGKKDLHHERQQGKSSKTNELVVCSACNGFFNRKCYRYHKKNCSGDMVCTRPSPLSPDLLLPSNGKPDFREQILSKFRNDEVGVLCKSNETLLLVGGRLFTKLKKKPDKQVEVRKSVMADMRKLGNLFIEFRKHNPVHIEECDGMIVVSKAPVVVLDMLTRDNFMALEDAISTYTSQEEGDVKAGLKTSLYYLLKNMGSIVKNDFLISHKDTKAAEVDRFLSILEDNHNIIFGDATYKLNNSRQTKLRRPENLPKDEDIALVRNYTINSIKSLAENATMSPTDYILLRDLCVCRLTMFNFRRGGEPARLRIKEWNDAKKGVWINTDRVKQMTDGEKQLFQQMKIIYQTGKGNDHLVPVLVPSDVIHALDTLSSSAIRDSVKVQTGNQYLFPTLQESMQHCSGWHAVNRVCNLSGIKDASMITATRLRHYSSTRYAALDVPEEKRETFYKHMGHSKEINASIYQTPMAEAEVTIVGKVLQQIDKGFACDDDHNDIQDQQVNRDNSQDSNHSQTDDTDEQDDPNFDIPEKKRPYTKWSEEDSQYVWTYFQAYMEGKDTLPGKEKIKKFLEVSPHITHPWTVVKAKIVNLKRLSRERVQRELKKMKM